MYRVIMQNTRSRILCDAILTVKVMHSYHAWNCSRIIICVTYFDTSVKSLFEEDGYFNAAVHILELGNARYSQP